MSFFVTVLRRDVVKSLKADNICSEQLGRYSSAMFWEQICIRLMCRLKLIYVIDQGESWAAFLNETFMLKKKTKTKNSLGQLIHLIVLCIFNFKAI